MSKIKRVRSKRDRKALPSFTKAPFSVHNSSTESVVFSNVKPLTGEMCDGVFKSIFFFSFPIMADLLLNPAFPLLFTENRERESRPAVHRHNYNTHTVSSLHIQM